MIARSYLFQCVTIAPIIGICASLTSKTLISKFWIHCDQRVETSSDLRVSKYAKDVFQFSIDWAPSIPTQDNGWDCGVHVIKHMQTFKNGDSMTVFNLCNSVKLRREIASDLVLHKGNREKQTIVAIVCTKTSTRAMKKLLL
ncbi:hypothetical protein VitviT2T_006813 [Vitis vinifera]|uniref:Ubiquitin-like protease family profile domain-containing protein n=1 Tax=Vitis vinifera TaxID=29760 RepID=A0ABY9BXW3_VITVI|nr:hypothetical protein VitviT2T_006813 [Vitis vinifera]